MFSVLAVTIRKTAEDAKHITIISGLRAIENNSFTCWNILIGVIGASGNLEGIVFFEKRALYRLNQQIMQIRRYNLISSCRDTTKE